jgi:hypothetical protein
VRCARVAVIALVLGGCSIALAPSRHHGGGGSDAGPATDGAPSDATTPSDGPRTDAPRADGGGCSDSDGDGDGYSECTGDCDDDDPTRHPDADPICDNGIVEACNAADRSALRSLLGDDLGVFSWTETLSAGARDDLTLAVTNGFSDPFGHPVYAVVGVLRPDNGEIVARAVNVAVLGEVIEHGPTDVLGAAAPLDLFSLGAANDYDGREVLTGTLGPTGAFGSSFNVQFGSGSFFPLGGSPPGVPLAVLTLAHGILSETVSTVLFGSEASGVSLSIHDAATGASRGTDILSVTGPDHVVRASPDGVIVVQDAAAPSSAAVHVLGGISRPLVGVASLVAPLGRDDAGEPVIVQAANALTLAGTTCAESGCTLDAPVTLHTLSAGESYVAVAGAPIPRGTALHGYAAAAAHRRADQDVLLLAIATAARAPTPTTAAGALTLELPWRAGQRVIDVEVAAQSQTYFFDETSDVSSRVTMIVVAALVEAAGSRHLSVTGIRACATP